MTTIIRDYEALKPEPRRAILERDKYTCRDCGYQGEWNDGTLDVHHIVPYRTGGEHTPDNLITLCDPCHKLRDRVYLGELKGKRTKENGALTGQLNIRLPKGPRAQLEAIRTKTGYTATQVMIIALSKYADELGIKL